MARRRVEPNHWHAYVATPAYQGKVDSDYAQSLASSSFSAPLYRVKVSHGVIGNGAFIELSRNIFVKLFLEEQKDCSHLFFIDSDLKFPANAFIGLIRSGLPICAGVYPRRQTPESYPAHWAAHPTMGGLWVEDDWIMHNRVPTGFLCIARHVLEEMSADAPIIDIPDQGPVPWVFSTKVDPPRFIGEDYAFCDNYVAKYGKPIPVWPDITFEHGGYKGNYLEYIRERAEPLKEPPTEGSYSEMSKAS